MKQEVKELWVKALRGGEYTQGRMQLRKDSTYCCLGVLCDLYRKETGQGQWAEGGFNLGEERSYSYLPGEVVNWSGMKSITGVIPERTIPYAKFNRTVIVKELTDANDMSKIGFVGIADIIDEEWENL